MERFPLLHTYRGLLQIVATLVVIVGFLSAIGAANETNQFTDETDFAFSTFAFVFGLSIVVAIGFLVTAELILLALTMEDHLFQIRQNTQSVPANTTATKSSTSSSSRSYSSARTSPYSDRLNAPEGEGKIIRKLGSFDPPSDS